MPKSDPSLEEAPAGSFPASRVLCRILINRGITDPDQARRFLNPDLDDAYDPSLLDGLDLGVERTRTAVESGEKIMVHGDYDVDGITSTALLVRVLRLMGADVSWYIPHRQREGYDIGRAGVDEAKARGAALILTVDCGSSAVDAVTYARELGIDVVITDHHEVGHDPAPAYALINPRKPGCPYPFKDLAGVGVAYKFTEALVRECGYDVAVFRRRFCDLAAIGTVADVVPLIDENRALVKFGLEELPRTGKKGLRALLQVAGIKGSISSQMIAFGLGPRLNAAGRLDDASVALKLLLSTDDSESVELARALDAQNRERQAQQDRIHADALTRIAEERLDQTSKVLVLHSQGWHPGIVGVVASKITDRFHRPAVLVAVDETGESGVGSARSIGAFDIFEALTQCCHLLERCGGHSMAAGLSISTEKIADFSAELNRIADELLEESDLLPVLDVDMELDLDRVDRNLATELDLLEPYGHGNRQPVFLSRGVKVLGKTRMGSTGAHMRLKLASETGKTVECVAFGWGDREEAFRLGSLLDVCYNVQINQYNGYETVQIVLRDARESGG